LSLAAIAAKLDLIDAKCNEVKLQKVGVLKKQ
jgi:hypothetical protein